MIHSPGRGGGGFVVKGKPQTDDLIIRLDSQRWGLVKKSDVGITTFPALTDTPDDYVGQASKHLAVKTAEDGVEFVDAPSEPVVKPAIGLHFAGNNWYLPGWALRNTGTNVSTLSGRLHAFVVQVGFTMTFAEIGFFLNTTSFPVGSVARLGVYQPVGLTETTFRPGALVVDAGTVAIDTTGQKSIVLSPDLVLDPGFYWMVIVGSWASGGGTFRSLTNTSHGSPMTSVGTGSLTQVTPKMSIYRSGRESYATGGLPADLSAEPWSAAIEGTSTPAVLLKAA